MSAPILATKLYIPTPRPKHILRPRLVQQLNAGLAAGHKLTLLSAAAGFGKTTLVSAWLTSCHQPGVWLALDEGDQDPTRFLAYLVAALQTLADRQPGASSLGAGVLAALQAPQPPSIEALLTHLINEIADIPERFIFVLDDYHLVASTAVDNAVAFLVEHLPSQMHLVIASREDPPLPLARLRARDQLTELRAADLRFTSSEAAEFINQAMGLELSPEDIAALEKRTEGWITGLHLAALSIQGQVEPGSFIQAFTGSHRFVLDYLVEEVLQRQPENIRSFLLQTAILERLCAPLCEAVTGQADIKALLDALERANMFIVPLDDQRQWYRYHHLFAEVLFTHLAQAQSEQIPELHLRASAWYEQNGLPADAIRHALAGRDFERAAGLLELAWSSMDLNYQSAAWLGWVKTLPGELLRNRPVLCLGYAWALLDGGELEACEARLQDAERWLDGPTHGMVIVDEALFRSLPAAIATARAYRSLALGNIPATVQYARQALEQTPEQDQVRLVQATALLGLAQYASGDLKAASQSLTDFHARLQSAGDLTTATGLTFVLASVKIAQGRLRQATSIYQQTLQLITSQGEPPPIGTADLYRGLSELCCERGDLDGAARHLQTARKLGEQAALIGWPHRLCVTQARLAEAQGNLEDALDLLDEARHRYVRGALPDARPLAALQARLWIRQGQLPRAQAWALERGLSPQADLSYLSEFEYLTLARLRIACYRKEHDENSIEATLWLLERLLQAAKDGDRMGSVLEILVQQALAHQARGSLPTALALLEQALALAEPEGYVQIFIDEGPWMDALLQEAAKHMPHPGYVNHLRSGLGQTAEEMSKIQPLVEPLSERELDVLRLLRTELSGPEIARQLVVSLNTLRTHTKNIYTKLGVNSRQAAVRQAEERRLL